MLFTSFLLPLQPIIQKSRSHILEARTEYFSIVAQGYAQLVDGLSVQRLGFCTLCRLDAFLRSLIYFIAADSGACTILSESTHDNEKTSQR
jgi:hypothetical protein